jgi:hypothetical protein
MHVTEASKRAAVDAGMQGISDQLRERFADRREAV